MRALRDTGVLPAAGSALASDAGRFPWFTKVVGLGPVGDEDRGFAINNDGTSIGHTRIKTSTDRAWISTVDGLMELLPIGTGYRSAWPGDINDDNISVGVAQTSRSGRYRFVMWIWASLPIDLGIPQDADAWPNQRAPVRVSNKLRVAATADDTPFTFKSGVMTELPVPNNAHAETKGINTCGDIVGTLAYQQNGGRFMIRWRRTVHGMPVCD